ncbi:MAG: hypothetical protein WCJ26_14775 [bacterium]
MRPPQQIPDGTRYRIRETPLVARNTSVAAFFLTVKYGFRRFFTGANHLILFL